MSLLNASCEDRPRLFQSPSIPLILQMGKKKEKRKGEWKESEVKGKGKGKEGQKKRKEKAYTIF